MLICEVIGHVWATKKEASLSGLKLMVVREMTPDYHPTERTFAAAGVVGAGIGEWVLTVSGSTARRAFPPETNRRWFWRSRDGWSPPPGFPWTRGRWCPTPLP